MSAKGLACTAASPIGAALGSENIERSQPNYSYRSANGYEVYHRSPPTTTTECVPPPGKESAATPAPAAAEGAPSTAAGNGAAANGATPNAASNTPSGDAAITSEKQSASASKLHGLVQHIYAAQARVQLEANEIKKAQGVATSAQKSLEEAANNVRVITAALQTAQQEVAAAAVRAQTAQMQLAAHDQLLFAARQKVDALSSQMVGLQAEDGVVAPKSVVNMQALLAQLKQPLPPNQTPTPIPPVDEPPGSGGAAPADNGALLDYEDYYTGT